MRTTEEIHQHVYLYRGNKRVASLGYVFQPDLDDLIKEKWIFDDVAPYKDVKLAEDRVRHLVRYHWDAKIVERRAVIFWESGAKDGTQEVLRTTWVVAKQWNWIRMTKSEVAKLKSGT